MCSEECVAKANEDIRQLKEALLLSNATKKDLAKIYSDHIKSASDYVC